jgi:hypothetical protein
METKIVTMTPEWAKSILDSQNSKNRAIRPNAVKKIASAILDGHWKLSHQGIAIDINGQLQDGQHRLAAVVQSGMSIQILLTTGCDPQSFDVLDCGVNRTAADALSRIGSINSPRCSAGLKCYILYKNNSHRVWTNIAYPPHTQIISLYQERRDEAEKAALIAGQAYKNDKLINQSAMVAFYLLAIDKGWGALAESFCLLLGNPIMQPERSAILAYRRMLASPAFLDKTYLQQKSLASMIKCFNYWVENIPLKLFKQPPVAPMPQIVSLPNFPQQQ